MGYMRPMTEEVAQLVKCLPDFDPQNQHRNAGDGGNWGGRNRRIPGARLARQASLIGEQPVLEEVDEVSDDTRLH